MCLRPGVTESTGHSVHWSRARSYDLHVRKGSPSFYSLASSPEDCSFERLPVLPFMREPGRKLLVLTFRKHTTDPRAVTQSSPRVNELTPALRIYCDRFKMMGRPACVRVGVQTRLAVLKKGVANNCINNV